MSASPAPADRDTIDRLVGIWRPWFNIDSER